MRDGLHVLDVIFEADELAEAEHGEHLHGGGLFRDEGRLHAFQAGAAGDIERFLDELGGEAAPAKIWMHQHAHAADVPFPTAEPLVQGGYADNLAVHHAEQRQVAAHVDVAAPVADDLDVLHAVLDEHALLLGDVEEQLVKLLFVIGLERAQHGLFAILQFDGFWKFLQFEFDAE